MTKVFVEQPLALPESAKYPILDTNFFVHSIICLFVTLRPPPRILKRGGLEGSGQRLISINTKRNKRKRFFFVIFFFLSRFFEEEKKLFLPLHCFRLFQAISFSDDIKHFLDFFLWIELI